MKILGKKVIDRDFREIFTSEIISVTGGIFAGITLLSLIKRLDLLPGLFILLPGFLETQGNIFGSLAARLGTLLHLEEIKPRFAYNKILYVNALSSTVLLLLVATVLGIIATIINMLLFHVTSYALLFVALFASIISLIIELPLTIWTTFWLYRHHYEPDDIMGPYVTTMGDIISIGSLLLATFLILT